MKETKKEVVLEHKADDIFGRLKNGGPIRLNDLEYFKINEVVNRTMRLSQQLNSATDIDQIRDRKSVV